MSTVTKFGLRLDMNCPEDRYALRQALAPLDIIAHDSTLGGGLTDLEIVVISDVGGEALSILIGSMDEPCEIGLSGYRSEDGDIRQFMSAGPICPTSFTQTVQTVHTLWLCRDKLIGEFRAGHCDLKDIL